MAQGDARRPLVMFSHGRGSNSLYHAWLAEFLAARGYVVAALDHYRANSYDATIAYLANKLWQRPVDIGLGITFLLDDPFWLVVHLWVERKAQPLPRAVASPGELRSHVRRQKPLRSTAWFGHPDRSQRRRLRRRGEPPDRVLVLGRRSPRRSLAFAAPSPPARSSAASPADRLYVLDWHRNLDPPCRRPGEPLTVTSDPTCNAARPRCGSCHQNLVLVSGYVTGGVSHSQAIPRAGAWRAPRWHRAWRHCRPRGGRRSRDR